MEFFEITPDYDLNLMKPGQNLYRITATIIESLKPILEEFNPDYVLVHGDTTTTMAGSIASFYSGAKVCHVEAGLRTNNKLSPFPEEINRQITGRICDYHFAPTQTSKSNLIKENISQDSILVTGNTVIDALIKSVEKVNENPSQLIQDLSKKIGNLDVWISRFRISGVQGFQKSGFVDIRISGCPDFGNPQSRLSLKIMEPVP